MLQSLHIRNLALVTELDLELTGGFNVITGETGAGKSLIIGAIQLLAGGRATPSLIRNGEDRCDVSARFGLATLQPALKSRLEKMLEEAGVEACDEEGLLLRRVITEDAVGDGGAACVAVIIVFRNKISFGGVEIDIGLAHVGEEDLVVLPIWAQCIMDKNDELNGRCDDIKNNSRWH